MPESFEPSGSTGDVVTGLVLNMSPQRRLLNSDRLLVLTESAATIETRTGARQTYRRKPNEPGRVLAWEIAP
jgi:hypothetical protein